MKKNNVQTTLLPRFIKALLRQPVDKTPIWLMRQAGRYLPEYLALREKEPDFITFCHTPELAAQATLQPLARFDLDAAILFSDILVVPAAMGLTVQFIKGEGPYFPNPIRNFVDIQNLQTDEAVKKFQPIMETVRLVRKQLASDIPLIGFAGSPWTCATYMVEGGSSKQFAVIKQFLYQNPQALHSLLERLAQTTTQYLNAQIQAGVQAVMLFDTWGGILSSMDYEKFSLQYLKLIAENLIHEQNKLPIPIIFFTKGGGQWLEKIAEAGCHAVGLDWTTDIGQAQKRIGDKVALQGNMDPCVLLSNPQQVTRIAEQICRDFGPHYGHVFNLGHGILPQTPPENVLALIKAVHGFSF